MNVQKNKSKSQVFYFGVFLITFLVFFAIWSGILGSFLRNEVPINFIDGSSPDEFLPFYRWAPGPDSNTHGVKYWTKEWTPWFVNIFTNIVGNMTATQEYVVDNLLQRIVP
ncbi:hypothetical protein HK096_008974, partial [Nowakowskiella sp. JEL0078]